MQDIMDRVTNISLRTTSGAAIGGFEYEYDAAGRRVACGKSGSAFAQDDTLSYGDNEKSELTNAVAAVDAEYRYAYDFDDDGNQTSIKTATGIWQVQYNGENRPIQWTLINSSTPNSSTPTLLSMSFDRMWRRVTKNAQRFIYDGYLQTAGEDSNVYIWDPAEHVATRPLVCRRKNVVTSNVSCSYVCSSMNVDQGIEGSKQSFPCMARALFADRDWAECRCWRKSCTMTIKYRCMKKMAGKRIQYSWVSTGVEISGCK